MNMRPPAPAFKGITAPSYNFDALIDGTRTTPFVYEIDLSTARSFTAGTAQQIRITGNCLMIDSAPDVGNGYLIFEGVQDNTAGQIRAPIYAQPGFVTRLPFANVYVANTAQPGKKLRFIYGIDLEFQMLAPSRVTAKPAAATPTNYFQCSTFLVGALTIISPASNTNGATIWKYEGFAQNATPGIIVLLAKSTTPTALNDGQCIGAASMVFSDGTYWFYPFNSTTPIQIAPGLGVYAYAQSTANYCAWMMAYELH
jgi:hypothetical protein